MADIEDRMKALKELAALLNKKGDVPEDLWKAAGVKAGCRIKDVEKEVKEMKKKISAMNNEEDKEARRKERERKREEGEEDEEDPDAAEVDKREKAIAKDRDLTQGREASRKKKEQIREMDAEGLF